MKIPIIKLLFDTKIGALLCRDFSQKFPMCDLLFFFSMLEIRTFTPTFDILKILVHNCNHQQGFVKQKTVTLQGPPSLQFSVKISWTLLPRLLFWVNFINVTVVTQNWNNIESKVSTVALLLALSISVNSHKNSLLVAYCNFSRLKIGTLTSRRFKNQTNDIFKLLGHNCNHQQVFLEQKIGTLHCCSFNLKFPKHCYFDCYFR